VGGEGTSFAKELLSHTLLTATDEFDLARQYKIGAQITKQVEMMESELGRPPSSAEVAEALETTEEKVETLIDKSEGAKKILVRANMRLVFHIARYYRYRGVAYPDLVQEGTFGLIKAVDKYDPDRGFRFSTYASWWIKQSVSRAIAEKSRIIRLPVHIHDMMVSISKVERQFMVSHSRKPTSQELAERLALPIQKVELLIKCSREVNSIDENMFQNRGKMSTGGEVQVKDRIQSQQQTPSYLNEKSSLRSELRRSMSHLSDREAQIVEMRFGLADGTPMTLEEIGKRFNVTRERIRQIEARALSKIPGPLV
jgi:RNA polymerase sigma factor (sigma-70 family)